eukprot:symbB.v1.2.017167.t1/scaffold1301.1/size126134/2
MEVVDAMHTKLHPYQGTGGLDGSRGEPAYVAVPTAMAPYPEFSEVVPAQPIWTSQNEQTAKHLGTTKRRWFFGESNIRQYQIYLTPKGSFGRDHPLIFSEI